MQFEPRDIHILMGMSRIQGRELHPKPIGMLGLNFSQRALLVEQAQPFVAE